MTAPQHPPHLLVASETRDFHHMVRKHMTPGDIFLEIGCSFGECTKLLGELGFSGVALDHAAAAVTQARQAVDGYAGITVVQADARDMAQVQRLCPAPSVILLDVGGTEPLDKVTSLLRLVLKTFHSRLILVKSEELAELASVITHYTLPDEPRLLAPFEATTTPRQLIELSHSAVVNDRLFALHRLRRAIHHEEVLKRIEEMCHDESPTVRKQAMHALKSTQIS
jgi:SAM-dependent methyltransferase